MAGMWVEELALLRLWANVLQIQESLRTALQGGRVTTEEQALEVRTLHQEQSSYAQNATGRLHSAFFLPEQLAVQGCPATSAFSGSDREYSVPSIPYSKLHVSFPGEPVCPGDQSSASLVLYSRECQHPTSPLPPPLPAQ